MPLCPPSCYDCALTRILTQYKVPSVQLKRFMMNILTCTSRSGPWYSVTHCCNLSSVKRLPDCLTKLELTLGNYTCGEAGNVVLLRCRQSDVMAQNCSILLTIWPDSQRVWCGRKKPPRLPAQGQLQLSGHRGCREDDSPDSSIPSSCKLMVIPLPSPPTTSVTSNSISPAPATTFLP